MHKLDYKSSGVNIDAGNEAVDRIKKSIKTTFSDEVLKGIGGFGSLYDLKKISKIAKIAAGEIREASKIDSLAVSYTHLTLPTKRIV